MTQVYVDADACPVRQEVARVVERLGLTAFMVSNGSRPIAPPRIGDVRLIFVGQESDAADNWIAERINPGDLCVTGDIPLASRCLEKGAAAIGPQGRPWTKDNIGNALAGREISRHLRELGANTRGQNPMTPADKSRFLSALDTALRALLKGQAASYPG